MENSTDVILSSKDLLSLKDQKTSRKRRKLIPSKSKSRSTNTNTNKLKKQEVTRIPKLVIRNKNSQLDIKKNLKIDSSQNIISTVCETDNVKLIKMDFQKRKSHSQTDLKRFQQNNVKMTSISSSSSSSPSSSSPSLAAKSVLIRNNEKSLDKINSRNGIEGSVCISKTFSFLIDPKSYELTPKISGMKIFASIMLNAWRKRRDDVKRLRDELNRMKKNNMKIKNQIHVLNSLFRIEQKQNDTLHYQLKKCEENKEKLEDMFIKLELAYNELREKKLIAEANFELQNKENDGLNFILGQTTTQLIQTMDYEKELTELLNLEQEKTIKLENEKNILYEKISELEIKVDEEEQEYQNEIFSKDNLISNYKTQLDALEKKLNELKSTETKLREFQNVENTQKQLIQNLTYEVNYLQSKLDDTLMKHFKSIFNRRFSTSAIQYIHLISFYLLPAVPLPSHFNTFHDLLQIKKY